MTPDPAPDLPPEALDALVHMLGEWSACDEEAQAAAAITALRARLAAAEAQRDAAIAEIGKEARLRGAAEAARDQAPTGAPLTMEAIRLVAAEGDLTPQAVLGAANFWIARMMRCAVLRALGEARDKCMPHNDDDGMDRQAKAQCADAILALANNPEAIKRIVEGRR